MISLFAALASVGTLLFLAPGTALSAEPETFSQEFASSGEWVVPAATSKADILVVGGGGGGGGVAPELIAAGGGGGGGAVTVCPDVALAPGQTLTVNIGSGGEGGGNNDNGDSGQPSDIRYLGNVICSAAGGAGGIGTLNASSDGGTSGSGLAGGTGYCPFLGECVLGGGGGGAGAEGTDATITQAGNGGDGVSPSEIAANSLFGDLVQKSGGGGGGGIYGVPDEAAGAGGAGGGGIGGTSPGTVNSGGGGGGGSNNPGFPGGSGFAVVRYQEDAPDPGPSPVPNSFEVEAPKRTGGPGIRTRIKVPGAGTIKQSATRIRSGKRVPACRTKSLKVKRSGSYRLFCKQTKSTKSARSNGPIKVRLCTTFRPDGGEARRKCQTVVLTPYRAPLPVTG